ncbi:hypothetical protein Xen7305DRAFT_00025180 [Xenococcus sp. PCC 7305]|uniref:hypothetical protein n=1 Tax=Xenococcus sp. PCC 7305 TaxID=102125 RepID=UPI0002ACB3CD|nr:hypothetical protein [Xenococcus sp. PCC 7305]ELS02800.1 hypothetical protein Xen7305DRAFT_00025180 [Xenococcus sp. PCC 7305]
MPRNIDYDKEEIPIDFSEINEKEQLIPFMYKRNSFGFEKELRLICKDKSSNSKGTKIRCTLNTLIKDIYISPKYNEREKKIVQTIVDKFKNSIRPNIEIKQSKLAGSPRH